SDVDDRGLGVFAGDERRAVAAALARRDRAPLDDLRFDPGHLPDVARGFSARHAAIERQAGPNEIETVIAAEANSGRIGEAVALGRHSRSHRPKAIELHAVHRAVLVGAG